MLQLYTINSMILFFCDRKINSLTHSDKNSLTHSDKNSLTQSDKGGLSEDCQLIVNAEKGLIYNMPFSCRKGGFISIRHNQIRNITPRLLKEMYIDIRVEPQLLQLNGETLQSSFLAGNEVRLYICARGF